MGQETNDFRKTSGKTLFCFSHLRWNFVFQRPQHLLVRAAQSRQVIYFEEPAFEAVEQPFLRIVSIEPGLRVVTPVLPQGTSAAAALRIQHRQVDELASAAPAAERQLWYYTPMALRFSRHLPHELCVYDCMDQLSAFKGAPLGLSDLEDELFRQADIVFTGGQSLYQDKRRRHPAVHLFPSSIDAGHFNRARRKIADPADQQAIGYPRVGFFGVIDERMDIELVAKVAQALPHVHFVMLGPTAKIDPAHLPKAPNLHWLGRKSYGELPSYLANWQAGWMPFALNASTRYISPTKTPEFLAAGLPVVSTAIVDVVRSYGACGLVEISDAADMPSKLAALLKGPDKGWLERADRRLAETSWDRTWAEMAALIDEARQAKRAPAAGGVLKCSTG
jgi:glycosyltransferase involved in cell wall biosynthesis